MLAARTNFVRSSACCSGISWSLGCTSGTQVCGTCMPASHCTHLIEGDPGWLPAGSSAGLGNSSTSSEEYPIGDIEEETRAGGSPPLTAPAPLGDRGMALKDPSGLASHRCSWTIWGKLGHSASIPWFRYQALHFKGLPLSGPPLTNEAGTASRTRSQRCGDRHL